MVRDGNGYKKHGVRMAARSGHLEVVRYLIEQCDAGVVGTAIRLDSALTEAAACGYAGVAADANLTRWDFSKALVDAARKGHVDVVQYLAERYDADVIANGDAGHKALESAASFDFVEVVRYLVEQRAVDVSANALTEGARHGCPNVVRYFVKQCGVDVNMKDKDGYTAVMGAAERGEIDLVRYLVEECNANVNSTAVRLAADHGYIELQRILTPFILPEATKDGVDVVLASGIPSTCSIPPSEIELTLFHENCTIGGDFLAKWLGSDVVVKLPISDAASTSFQSEVRLWQKLRHPNVLKMYGACDAGSLLKFFVCEYASTGSLLEHVTSTSVMKRTMWKYLYEAALGLEYLHERGVLCTPGSAAVTF